MSHRFRTLAVVTFYCAWCSINAFTDGAYSDLHLHRTFCNEHHHRLYVNRLRSIPQRPTPKWDRRLVGALRRRDGVVPVRGR